MNKYNPEIHHRRSIGLKNYDYSQAGAYFVTLCSQNRACLFGTIENQQIELNEYGLIVQQIWEYLPIHFDNLELDAAVIMPNHFHGIIIITCRGAVSAPNNAPNNTPNNVVSSNNLLSSRNYQKNKTNLSSIVAYFKYQTTKLINQQREQVGSKLWQRNYYEHIIRNEQSLQILRQYIQENPLKWELDQLHPNNPSKW